jgi:hypothetical protein
MATVEADRFIHLSRPLAPGAIGYNVSNAPIVVNIQPQVCVPLCVLPLHAAGKLHPFLMWLYADPGLATTGRNLDS